MSTTVAGLASTTRAGPDAAGPRASRARAFRARRALVPAAILCGAAIGPITARAEPHCMARALADVPAWEAPEEVRSKSSGAFGPITQIKVDKSTGRMYYCARNTYCYDSNAFQLSSPCRIKLDKSYDYGNAFVYFTR